MEAYKQYNTVFGHFSLSKVSCVLKAKCKGICVILYNVLGAIFHFLKVNGILRFFCVIGFIAMVIIPNNSQAQNKKVIVFVKDSLMCGIGAANCSVVNLSQNNIVLSTWSKDDGEMEFMLPNGHYEMKVSHMGFISKNLFFEINNESDSLNLGTIILNMDTVQLGEVVVTQRRIVRKGGVISVTVKGSPLEKVGTCMDVLKEIPRVVIQGDAIAVLGKGVPVIFINDRRLTNKEELQSLKSTEVKKVEVLSNPVGRYGVNASSAIIITTSIPSNELLGFDIMDKIGTKGAPQNLLNTTGYFNSSKFQVKIGVTHNYVEKKYRKQETYSYLAMNNSINNTSIGNQNNVRKDINFLSELGYRFNQHHSVDFYVHFTPKLQVNEGLMGELQHNVDSKSKIYSSDTRTNSKNSNVFLNGAYHFRANEVKLDVSAMYFHTNNSSNRTLVTDDEISNFFSSNYANNWNLKTDLEYKISTKLKFLSGIEYGVTHRNGRYAYLSSLSNSSDLFKQTQTSAYAGLHYIVNERWSFQAEMGLDNTDFKYYQNNSLIKDQSRSSFLFLPSLSVLYEKDAFSLETSYRKTVDRPSYDQLSANNFMTNKYLRWDGNPMLRNSFAHTFETNVAYDWASVSFSYSQVKDGYFDVSSLLESDELIVKTSPENLPNYNQFYIGLSLNPQINKLGVVADVGVQFQDLKYGGVSYDKPLVEYSLRVNYNLSKSMTFRCGVSGHIKNGSYATGETKGYSNFDLRLSKSWINERLITQIYLTDIFNNAYERIFLNTNNIIRRDYSSGGTRGVFFTLQYRWGKNKKGKSRNLSKEMMRLMPD